MSELLAGPDEHQRRTFRWLLLASALAHLGGLLLVGLGPGVRPPAALPGVIMVDLVAAAPAARRRAAAKPASRPAPRVVPKPVPIPKPPPPQERKVVLPKEPEPIRKTPPAPPREAKPVPKPKPAPPAPSKPEEVEYEDVLQKLRDEAGEPGEAEAEPLEVARAAPGQGGPAGGQRVSAEVAVWLRAARIHVRNAWVLAPGFRDEPLETWVSVTLGPDGVVRGEPRVTRRSGNPWYDESVVRAVRKASPLPAPPDPGDWSFVFRPEDRL